MTTATQTTVSVEYRGSVKTPAGWRSVYYKGTADKISDKRVKIVSIDTIDDEPVSYNMSRTGANRQKFNGHYFAGQEIGKIKNISSLHSIK